LKECEEIRRLVNPEACYEQQRPAHVTCVTFRIDLRWPRSTAPYRARAALVPDFGGRAEKIIWRVGTAGVFFTDWNF